MTRIDLDDLPPKIAALLAGLAEGEDVLLVKDGLVVGRLTAAAAASLKPPPAEPEIVPEERAKEIFELFRASVEDEF